MGTLHDGDDLRTDEVGNRFNDAAAAYHLDVLVYPEVVPDGSGHLRQVRCARNLEAGATAVQGTKRNPHFFVRDKLEKT